MPVVMFGAFKRTLIAYLGTDHSHFFRLRASHTQYLCSGDTNSSTFHIHLYALCHFVHVFFLEAGGGTMITDGGAA
jgi:hypothetical protein